MDINWQQVEDYLLSYEAVFLDYPFGEEPAVYKIQLKSDQAKMFALLVERSGLMRLSLKCDPQLAITLRDRYESVLPGYHLAKKHWNTIILSGQLSWSEIQALIEHSYQLVCQNNN